MSGFRVTEGSMASNSIVNLQLNLSKISNLQSQLSSQRKLSKPSDSPTGTASALQLRSDSRRNDQYVRNASDGYSWLGTADSAMQDMLDQVRKVRELALTGLNTGSNGNPATQQALATEVSSVRDGLISTANTTYLNRPVFGGTTSSTTAYDSTGTYVGDNGAVTRSVGANSSVQVNVPGPDAFGTGSGQLFSIVASIMNNLTTNPSALGANLDALDAVTNTMTNQLSTVGARMNRVTDASQAANDRNITLTQNLSDVQDIDLPKTIVDLQLQEASYQSALSATSRAITPSLVDFLK